MDGNGIKIECRVTIAGEYVGRAFFDGRRLIFRRYGRVHRDGQVEWMKAAAV